MRKRTSSSPAAKETRARERERERERKRERVREKRRLHRIVVLPALSRPRTSIRASFSPKSCKNFENQKPIVSRRAAGVFSSLLFFPTPTRQLPLPTGRFSFSRLLSSSLFFSLLLSSSLFFSLLFSFVFCGDGFVCVRRPFEGIEGQAQMGLSSQSVKDFPSAKGLVFSFLEPTAETSSALFEAASSSHAQPRIITFSKTRKTLHCYSN